MVVERERERKKKEIQREYCRSNGGCSENRTEPSWSNDEAPKLIHLLGPWRSSRVQRACVDSGLLARVVQVVRQLESLDAASMRCRSYDTGSSCGTRPDMIVTTVAA